MSFCCNCGNQLKEDAKFCGNCGTPVVNVAVATPVQEQKPHVVQQPVTAASEVVPKENSQAWRQHATAEENALVQGERVSPNVFLGSDGKYRWVYELKVGGNPTTRWIIMKVMAYILIAAGLLIGLLLWVADDFLLDSVLPFLGIWFTSFIVIELLVLVIVPIVSAVYKGSYYTIFEMDDKAITQIQMKKTFQRTQAMAVVFLLTEDNIADAYVDIKMATKDRYDSAFSRVRKVREYRKHDLIDLNGWFLICPVYAEPEDYDFVKDYILNHVPRK